MAPLQKLTDIVGYTLEGSIFCVKCAYPPGAADTKPVPVFRSDISEPQVCDICLEEIE